MSALPAPVPSLPEPLQRQFDAFQLDAAPPGRLRAALAEAYRRDERQCVQWLNEQKRMHEATIDVQATDAAIASMARALVTTVRGQRAHASGADALMREFSLSSEEGVALMCIAEALLRIPDTATANRLIADKIGKGDWRRHLGESPSLFVNAAAWGLLITGRLLASDDEQGLASAVTRLIARGGEPIIRKGVDLAMRMLGNQFVAGQTIEAALAGSRAAITRGYRHSFDMLGEAACTARDAARYHAAYTHAIHAIGAASAGRGIKDGPGISVKLSALHPRYCHAQRDRVMWELLPRLKSLAVLAKHYDIGMNIDAEEADRLLLSLDLFEALAFDPDLAGFEGMGFVVQAYQKRCPHLIDYLADLSQRSGRKFMVRLVKGAYWDTEIKRAQVDGMTDYPVYTRKAHTDMSYLVCAARLLQHADRLYPQFATHNAHSLAAVHVWAAARGITEYEFQCLYGMGETLYDQVVGVDRPGARCRIYAPVGSHRSLLAYLVRRLLENGANTSFVNRLVDDSVAIETLIADPFHTARAFDGTPHPRIPLPAQLYGTSRQNSAGLDLSDESALRMLASATVPFMEATWTARALIGSSGSHSAHGTHGTIKSEVRNPAKPDDLVGFVLDATPVDVEMALDTASTAFSEWRLVDPVRRAALLEHAACQLETARPELLALIVREAGKSWPNAVGEVREAIDFLRYYAARIVQQGAGVAHRSNEMSEGPAIGLGVILCISPWNFPLAIFMGQVAAALAAGNVVVAKPAEQTSLIACRAVALLHAAGVPPGVVQLLPGPGETVGAALCADHRIRGVLFTGSTPVARSINRVLARRAASEGCELPLIAETGGQNAMIVDSSALPEQVVQDVMVSAFDSAGQRCSALRILCLQEDIADEILHMLRGAMREMRVGDPSLLATDVGPVIDRKAQERIETHVQRFDPSRVTRFGHRTTGGLQRFAEAASFVMPTVIEIDALAAVPEEVFGPVLHVVRFGRSGLADLLTDIRATGYGLTMGVQSRIDETVRFVAAHSRVGNLYVNRGMIGAVVGTQPFGGMGLSGTGPKAGGPLYLARLQRYPESAVVTVDTVTGAAEVPTNAQTNGKARFELPGPTGEYNTLEWRPRGLVLCVAPDAACLRHQVDAAFAAGNDVAVMTASATDLAAHFSDDLIARIKFLHPIALSEIEISLALVDASMATQWVPALAARQGAIVPVLMTSLDAPIPAWRLLSEYTVTVNTAATGGNARLMTLGD